MTVKILFFGVAGIWALLIAMPALAQGEGARVTVGVTGGSLGVGPEVGVRISPTIGVRASASFLEINHDFGIDDIDYHGKAKLESYGAVVDLYPFSSGFRISGGARIDKNRVHVVSTPTSPVTVGDATFTPAQIGTLSGEVDAEEFAPTVTVGYAGGLTKGLKFGVDAGVMFQGKPEVHNLAATGSLATNPTFIAELEKERVKINDKVDDYKFYPIVQLSVFYAF